MGQSKTICFHTNIPSPYRKHQFELFANVFHRVEVFFSENKPEKGRPWSNRVDDWKCVCLFEQQWKRILRLLFQRWGTVHLLAYPGGRVYQKLLLFSGLCRHSRLIQWNDAGLLKWVPNYAKRPLHRRVGHWLWLKAHVAVYTPGEMGKRFSMALGFSERQIINCYFSHDVEKFVQYRESRGTAEREKLRKALGIDESKICILTISRFLDWKRLVDVAQALLLLEQEQPNVASNCEFILIGDGDCQDHAEILGALTHIRVHVINQMPPDEVLAYYCAADIFAFPSEGDIWGLVVNEALTLGVPVICTEVIGAAEMIRDGENGYLVPPRRPDLLAKKIGELASDRRALRRFSENAMTIVSRWRTERGVRNLMDYLQTSNKL